MTTNIHIALQRILDLTSPEAWEQPQWALIGSAATMVQGVDCVPGDIDLLASMPAVTHHFAAQMAPFAPAQCRHAPGHEQWLSSTAMPLSIGPDGHGSVWHFGRWSVEGVKVEIAHIAPLEVTLHAGAGAGIWEAGPAVWPHLRQIAFAGHELSVVPLEIQLGTCWSRRLDQRADAILALLHRNGYDAELLRKALSAEYYARFESHINR